MKQEPFWEGEEKATRLSLAPVEEAPGVEEGETSDDDMVIVGGESGEGKTWDTDSGQWVSSSKDGEK